MPWDSMLWVRLQLREEVLCVILCSKDVRVMGGKELRILEDGGSLHTYRHKAVRPSLVKSLCK